jgi:hypothetical protein
MHEKLIRVVQRFSNDTKGRSPMRCYTNQYKYYVGFDIHKQKIYVCSLDEKGEIRKYRNLKTP